MDGRSSGSTPLPCSMRDTYTQSRAVNTELAARAEKDNSAETSKSRVSAEAMFLAMFFGGLLVLVIYNAIAYGIVD